MDIKLQEKFTDRDLDKVIHDIYMNHKNKALDKYNFDFTEVEFIGNQELLVLSALFKTFIQSNIEFEVEFFKKGVSTSDINERVKRQIIQFWVVWKIWKIVPDSSYYKYFGIDGNSVERLQNDLEYYPKLSEIYTRHGVTPFISLDYINNYDEIEVQKRVNPIYKLNEVIEGLLYSNKCHHPFTSNSLSTIITEELYLNFLDHSIKSSFDGFSQQAFMSISFQGKLNEDKFSKANIQKQKFLNFTTECLEEAKEFFYDSKSKQFKNQPYIQFSFLDFGQGISNTLKKQFQSSEKKVSQSNLDSDVLRFAFNHYSSRHPIFKDKNKIEQFIPRGLFDVLTIVRRYKGLLVVRSNNGKILYDFSNTNDVNKAFSYFGNKDYFFPGTLISLYIPAIEDSNLLNISSIKPEVEFAKVKPANEKYVSITNIAHELEGKEKELLYSALLDELKKKICTGAENSLVFVSFRGCKLPKRITKKTLYFLLSDYDINHKNNVVILHSPAENVVEEIASELLMLNNAIKNYKIHPLPIIDFPKNGEDLNVTWLGIYNFADKEKLNNLLFEDYSLAKSDFEDHANISGHLNEFDSFGNLISNFPYKGKIISYYKKEEEISISKQIEELLKTHCCIKTDDQKSLYLCRGNYYQREYVELNNLINDKNDCNTATKILFGKIQDRIGELENYKLIGITASSHKMLKSLEVQGLINRKNYISLDNYNDYENELTNEDISQGEKYILICDVFSTGYQTKNLQTTLNKLGATIELIGVVVSISDSNYENPLNYSKEFRDRLIYLHKKEIQKYKRNSISQEVIDKEIIRINPHTNIPIRLNIKATNYYESIVFPSDISLNSSSNEIIIKNKFLETVDSESIYIGFLKFNNLIHPYFFNTDNILKEIKQEFLSEIFRIIKKQELNTGTVKLFYPRKSGIANFNFGLLKAVLHNDFIEDFEIERFGTPEGWKFPHNIDYLNTKIENSFCFVLDDGSCSGDSLIQIIDEISFYDAKEIVLLCFIGRVNDHKREFFSRLSNIKVKNGKSIPISIYFVTHWHIPTYYLDENPNIKETTWLNDIVKLQNTPQSIKKIAKNIIKEVSPKNIAVFKDYKYLPRERNTNEIPKKELLIVREELGKVIGYRLYKESFNFFDCFIKKYQKRNTTKDYFKEIELLCATFIYEPYLYDKIVNVLPDVTERIENFVENLIFINPEIYKNLTYKWNRKDIVHLFFIVYKNEKLLEKLTIERFKILIEFTEQVDSTINYILYKLLKYFPLNTSQFGEKKFDKQIKDLINKLKNDNKISNKEIKKYYNFITSLPSRDDFNSQLSQLIENYAKQKEPEFHDKKKSFNHNVSELIVTIREVVLDIKSNKQLPTNKLNIIRTCWFKILDFINPILSFSSSFTDFLRPYTFFELVNQTTSLREMVGFIEEMILSTNESMFDLEKLETIKKHVTKIQLDFELNSIFHQVIENSQSSLDELVTTLKSEINTSFKISEAEEMPTLTKSTLNIPKVYVEKLLVAELTTNMKKYSKNENAYIILNYKLLNQDQFELQIINEILNISSQYSNGEGTKCLRLLSESNIFGFKYHSDIMDNKYIQTLTFNLN